MVGPSDLLRGCSQAGTKGGRALAVDLQIPPFCLSLGSGFLGGHRAEDGVGVGVAGLAVPHTHLSRPRMKALKRMVWLVSSGNWLTWWQRLCRALVDGPGRKPELPVTCPSLEPAIQPGVPIVHPALT